MTITSLAVAVYHYNTLHSTQEFFYNKLLRFVDMHPAYLGMYISFAVIYLSVILIQQYNSFSSLKKFFFLALISWFLFYLLLLTSKTAIISTIIFVNAAFLYWGNKYKKRIFAVVMFLLMNAIGIITLFSLPTTKERMRVLYNMGEANYENSVEARQYIWRAMFSNMQSYWITGVGNGDDTETLISFYEKENYKKGIKERYNAHNQFLQIVLMCGISGLLVYIFIYVYQLRLAWKLGDSIYFLFLLLFIINCLTESMLEVQSGIFFFALFNALFLKLHFLSKPETLTV
jgi:O-antigen ligase